MDWETVIKGFKAMAVLELEISGNSMAEPRLEGVFHVSET